MPKTPRRPQALRGRVFAASTALRRGLLTPADLRSTAWQRLFRGVYADATLTISHRHRCLAACRYLLPAGAVVAGRSAAALYGVGGSGGADAVEVLMPRPHGPVAGLRVHVGELPDDEIRDLGGVRVTTPARTAWDLAQWLDPVEAVVILDLLVRRRLLTVADLESYARARTGRRGWRRLSRAATLVDPGAESPQESRLRVRIVLAGLPRPVTQYVIERGGAFVARADLAWPDYKVAVEYDGIWHAGDAQIHRDRRRLNRMLGADWIVLHVTADRLRTDFEGFLAELCAALRSRR